MKKIIILAGGEGKRLHPYTISMPKPMVPIGNLPILEILILKLKKHGFKSIIISVNFQANIIMDYFGDGKKWKVNIEYIFEKKPLGTMGPLNLIKNIPDNFIIMNGDIITDLNFDKFYKKHMKSKKPFTISCFERDEKIDYGVLALNKNNILQKFSEKPIMQYLVSMGIYAVNKSIIKYIDKNKNFGFDDLMKKLLKNKIEVNAIRHDGYWLDVGRPSDYLQAQKDINFIKKKIL
jgi:NDP-mannose synthase